MKKKLIAAFVAVLALFTASTAPASGASANVWYQAHVQGYGDMNPVFDGATAGTVGESKRLEALRVYGTPIEYRVHSQDVGWGPWVQDAWAGTRGRSLRAEAIQVRMGYQADPRFHVRYRAHVEDVGWQGWREDGATAGTTGKSLRMEAVQIEVVHR